MAKKKQMLINYVPGEESRIAITQDGKLEELYHERAVNESHVGNIYKGRVVNLEPSIQAGTALLICRQPIVFMKRLHFSVR